MVIKKIAVFCVFHDHIDVIPIEQSVPQFDDMRVIDLTVQFDLPFYQFQLGLCRKFLDIHLNEAVGYHLDGVHPCCVFMAGQSDCSERSAAQFLIRHQLKVLD